VISEGSWSDDAENSALRINYIFKYIKIENSHFKLQFKFKMTNDSIKIKLMIKLKFTI